MKSIPEYKWVLVDQGKIWSDRLFQVDLRVSLEHTIHLNPTCVASFFDHLKLFLLILRVYCFPLKMLEPLNPPKW